MVRVNHTKTSTADEPLQSHQLSVSGIEGLRTRNVDAGGEFIKIRINRFQQPQNSRKEQFTLEPKHKQSSPIYSHEESPDLTSLTAFDLLLREPWTRPSPRTNPQWKVDYQMTLFDAYRHTFNHLTLIHQRRSMCGSRQVSRKAIIHRNV